MQTHVRPISIPKNEELLLLIRITGINSKKERIDKKGIFLICISNKGSRQTKRAYIFTTPLNLLTSEIE